MASPDDIPSVTVEDAHELVADGALLLDVREIEEWTEGHAPSAVLIPMSELGGRVGELPTDRAIVAVCRSGARSAAVTAALHDAGFDVVNLEGGMRAWAAADFPVVDDQGREGAVV
jgi:rhodanese-related sulfurtransferase